MNGHHIWCNFCHRDPKNCAMCDGLRKLYPEVEDDLEGIKLAEKYFPEAIPRTHKKEREQNG